MHEGAVSASVYAPVPVAAASALLWIQGAIWAALGSTDVAFCPDKTPLNDLLITVFFGFTVLSAVLGLLLPRPGSGRTRGAVIWLQWFMTALGLAVLGALAAFPVLLWFTPDAGGFALAGSIMAACAAGGLRSRSARAFYQPACLPHRRTTVPAGRETTGAIWPPVTCPRRRRGPARRARGSGRIYDAAGRRRPTTRHGRYARSTCSSSSRPYAPAGSRRG